MLAQLETVETNCCVCGGSDSEEIASGWDFEYRTTTAEQTFVCCISCGHYYLNPRPTAEMLPTIYPPNYYAYDLSQSVNSTALKVKQWLEQRKMRALLKHCQVTNPNCLDIGCGDGRLLDVLASAGVSPENLSGVELSLEVIERIIAKGYRGHYGRIEDLELPENSFDLIYMFQVIEHVEDPAKILATVARLLKPGGVFVVETPNIKSLDARLFRKRYWGGYHFPRHWNLFHKDSLEKLAVQSKLDMIDCCTFVCAVFWIYPFHHWLRERGAPERVYRFFWPMSNPLLLAAATLLDLVLAPFGATSNLRAVFQKPRDN